MKHSKHVGKDDKDLSAEAAEPVELTDKYLRALADSDNARKRMRQQSEETVRLQRENLLRDLLPIVDNLERAVAAARGGGNGKPFDPQRHEAIAQVESSQHPPNTVLEEHHRGYLIGDRMLRPARVSVVKPGSEGNGDKNGKAGDTDVENN